MAEKFYGEISETMAMRVWVLSQMLRGMGWAALGTLIVGGILLAIWGVSLLLPQASKEAPSPYTSQLAISAPLILTA